MNNNNNHHNSPNADFAESIMAKIYGEQSDFSDEDLFADSAAFRAELGEFSEIRQAIHAWRDAEFAPLETPFIELPKATKVSFAEINSPVVVEKSQIGWLENLKVFFSFSSPFAAGATAFAAIAICAVMLFIFSSSQTEKTTANIEKGTPKKIAKVEIAPTPTPEVVTPKPLEKTEVAQTESTVKPTNSSTKKPVEVTNENRVNLPKTNSAPKPQVVRVTNNTPRQTGNRRPPRAPRNPAKDDDLRDVESGFREILSKDDDNDSLSLLDILGEDSSK